MLLNQVSSLNFFFLYGQLGVSHMCNAGNESLRLTWDSISLSPGKNNLFVRSQKVSDLSLKNVPSLDQLGTAGRPLNCETGR